MNKHYNAYLEDTYNNIINSFKIKKNLLNKLKEKIIDAKLLEKLESKEFITQTENDIWKQLKKIKSLNNTINRMNLHQPLLDFEKTILLIVFDSELIDFKTNKIKEYFKQEKALEKYEEDIKQILLIKIEWPDKIMCDFYEHYP